LGAVVELNEQGPTQHSAPRASSRFIFIRRRPRPRSWRYGPTARRAVQEKVSSRPALRRVERQFEFLPASESALQFVVPAHAAVDLRFMLYSKLRRIDRDADRNAVAAYRWSTGFCSCGGWGSTLSVRRRPWLHCHWRRCAFRAGWSVDLLEPCVKERQARLRGGRKAGRWIDPTGAARRSSKAQYVRARCDPKMMAVTADQDGFACRSCGSHRHRLGGLMRSIAVPMFDTGGMGKFDVPSP